MKKKILVIDDKLGLLEEVKDVLIMEGYEVHTACNLLQGIKKIHDKSPDLIITDLILPQVSGYEALRNIETLKKDKNIPVIILSANADNENVKSAKKLSIDHYIKKPCTSDLLIETVYSTIHQPYEQHQINSCR